MGFACYLPRVYKQIRYETICAVKGFLTGSHELFQVTVLVIYHITLFYIKYKLLVYFYVLYFTKWQQQTKKKEEK